MKKNIIVFQLLLFLCCLNACKHTDIEEKTISGFPTKTVYDSQGNIEVFIAKIGGKTVIAVPNSAISRQKIMSDDELDCLAKCVKIADVSERLNCTLLCPVTKQYQIFVNNF